MSEQGGHLVAVHAEELLRCCERPGTWLSLLGRAGMAGMAKSASEGLRSMRSDELECMAPCPGLKPCEASASPAVGRALLLDLA